ncbi:hypothetical protein HY358_01675 [Candidatus Roizmanbacteria bacterium]|nr:hypothetical protein [Candidatus Roizmanbacteria bacterium]
MRKDGEVLASDVRRICCLSGEEVIVAKREHLFTLVLPIAFLLFGVSTFFIAVLTAFLIFQYPLSLLILMSALIFVFTASVAIKLVIDWYYHLYVITTRRIVEISCAPFYSHKINDVLLDQVRITEVDVQIRGVLYELLDMGDVVIYFDRPSHEEAFALRDIKNPGNTGNILSNKLEDIMHESPIWFNQRTKNDKYKFTEDYYDRPRTRAF